MEDDPYGYDDYHDHHYGGFVGDEGEQLLPKEDPRPVVNFEDPEIASLPRILLMGPRRSGKTSIQVRSSGDIG